jgi:L-lactate dehydrogenase (cytochrome)/(S)-mandelate dehydrogenase
MQDTARRQIRVMRPELNWEDLRWMREQWHGQFYVKGILHQEDAERAVGLGVDGIVVSNHGGRQLDGAQASLDALPDIVAQVNKRVPVLLDGGVRRGADVVKALCLGASAVAIGRPWLYGLAVNGGAGVEQILAIFREEMLRTLTLLGCPSVSALDRSMLV